ncbi:MAG: PHP domain-containing protein [Planctomycetes bacterium]|nr:PHP domain-containing protein [Planctomycetota bacterium]
MSDPVPRASFDLHLHTYWSYDATAPPETHFKAARKFDLRCIAITEHHVLDSLDEVMEIAQDYPDIRTIPAAELTVTTSLGTFDLCCYGFLPDDLRQVLDTYHKWQHACGEARTAGVNALGHDYTDAHRVKLLESYRPPKTIARQGHTHVRNGVLRQYFVERGFIEKEEDYGEFLSQARKKVPFPPYPDVEDVVPVVKAAGALVSIAHPYGYFGEYDESRMDAICRECQLDGIECAHKSVPPEFSARYREYCVQHGLFSTAGSDCHDEADIDLLFARHGGADEWLDGFLDRLDRR